MVKITMKERRLGRTSLFITEMGFGGSGIGNLYRALDNRTSEETVKRAWELEIRYFDTAPHYGCGLSERRLGLALRDYPRQDYILSTKVGRLLRPRRETGRQAGDSFPSEDPFNRVYDYSYEGIIRSFEDSYQRLGSNQIEILFMHDIGRYTHGDKHNKLFKTAMESGYKALDQLRGQGLVKAVGLGVNEWQVCYESFRYADFDCFMLAGRYTLLEQEPLDIVFPECEKRGVSIIAAGVYNSGILVSGPGDHARYDYEVASPEIQRRAARIFEICGQYGIHPSAPALQFPLLHAVVSSVVVGMNSPRHVDENVANLQVEIPDDLWRELVSEKILREGSLPEV